MSENQDTNDVEALKAKIEELEVEVASVREENEKLKDTLTKASDALQEEVDKQRKTLVDAILQRTEMCQDDLEKLDLKQLKLIDKALCSVKQANDEGGDHDKGRATVKNIRSAAGAGDKDNTLTVGNLYHKSQEAED